jgi:hypothetical protein
VFSGEKFGAKDAMNLFVYVSPTMFRPQSMSIRQEAFGRVFWRKIWGEKCNEFVRICFAYHVSPAKHVDLPGSLRPCFLAKNLGRKMQ